MAVAEKGVYLDPSLQQQLKLSMKTRGRKKGDDLKSRIFSLRLPKRSATDVLQRWVSEGHRFPSLTSVTSPKSFESHANSSTPSRLMDGC
ncbi:hypothetical protein K7X08_038104 [Anisodus acutangulus]|uniref:Uncharacterized protein n=1 Tax=Anisodus acutangulus TaxID=402998 RepID=A0A9Q1MY67_9SOLA|nr:hypothetical protein K7X08_038104 [Anisodus acutangulus]